MSQVDLIPVTDTNRWRQVLDRVGDFDFYHLPEYHWIAEENGEGKGVLFVYKEANHIVAWPFLLRPVEKVAGLEQIGSGFQDATSVYGYPGPISTPGVHNDLGFIQHFGTALHHIARELRLVSMFSRLNPLLDNINLAHSVGKSIDLGETVSIDLSLSPEMQWSHYRKSHRYEIKRSRKAGIRAYHDQEWSAFDEFINLYATAMKRLGAAEHCLFDKRYFWQLRKALGDHIHLFAAEQNGIVCSAALFVHTGNIIQYHLSASNLDYAKISPSKLVLDEARTWGNTTAAHYLHLGGGVGSQKDNLFSFKAGFSPLRHKFFVWNYIALPEVYSDLIQTRRKWLVSREQELMSTTFFPLYRAV